MIYNSYRRAKAYFYKYLNEILYQRKYTSTKLYGTITF